jgi:ribonuclease HII
VEGSLPKPLKSKHSPKFTEEKLGEQQGFKSIAGIDEVGRGCLAGPVVAAAVIMPADKKPKWFKQVRDSKLLTPERREFLSPRIHEVAISVGTGVVAAEVIDSLGMTRAVYMAMTIAIEKLMPPPDYLLIDYLTIPDLKLPQKGVENGDTLCFSIACASIVAKVFRDHLMIDLDQRYPGYGLAHHKGYGTEEHVAALRNLGPSPLHRRLFQPIRNLTQLSFDDLQEMSLNRENDET